MTARRAISTTAALALIAVIAGCGSSADPSAAATAFATSSSSPLPSASATPSPSPSPSPSLVPSGSPAGELATISDPDLSIRLPAGWQPLTIEELRQQIARQMTAAPKRVKDAYAELIEQIDAGQVRLSAIGPSGFVPWQATLAIEITDAKSIEEQLERNRTFQLAFAEPRIHEQTDVTLSIGRAVRIDAVADPPTGTQGVPAHGIDYVAELEDGRILWFTSTGPEASTTFEAMIDATVASLSAR